MKTWIAAHVLNVCRVLGRYMFAFLPFSFLTCWAQGVPWVSHHGLTAAEYQAKFTEYAGNGFRLVRVSGYSQESQAWYAAIWEQRSGPPWVAVHGLTASEYQVAFDWYGGNGYRLKQVSGYKVGGQTLYACIWEQDGGPAWRAVHGVNASDYQTQFDLNAHDGYRLVCVSGYEEGGLARYAAVWEYGSTYPWVAAHGLTASQYQTAFTNHSANGFRLTHVSGYEVGGQARYAAIWEQRGGPTWFSYHGHSSAEHQSKFDTFGGCRYRLVEVSGYDVGGQANFAAVWERDPISILPASGIPRPQLQAFDDAMQQFMRDRGLRSGTLCVAKDSTIVLERGYGWKTADHSVPLRYDALLRIASLCKPITDAAITKLVAANALEFSDFAFDLGQSKSGILSISPVNTPDSDLDTITVQHLLDHEGGWDTEVSGDPMFKSIAIANALGVSSPPTKMQTVNYWTGQPLDFVPGDDDAYANFGYMLLGLIVEEVTTKLYTTYIQDEIFTPIGVPPSEIELGGSLPGMRNSREPWYFDPDSGKNVFNPSQTVPYPDGGWYLEAMEAHGGLICSARAYTTFLTRYWINGEPRGSGQSANYTFFGSLDGTFTCGRQMPSGVSYSAFFNQREDCTGFGTDDVGASGWTADLTQLLDAAANGVTSWPATDPQTIPMQDPKLQIEQEGLLKWRVDTGRVYQVEISYDLENWQDYEPYQVGDSVSLETDVSLIMGRNRKAYFRLSVD
ncbi:serine hydrolase [bacterium]|nr:serine hydrolase [bacterium]